MIIRKIKLHNIRSYLDSEIEFPEGSTVLAGDIGSGKTSVLLAIEFALFGLQPGQKGSSLLRNGTEEGSVSLEIELDNNIIEIERGLKRGKSVNQSFAKITINNETNELAITELKNKVLELLQYPKEFAKKTNFLYKFTVYTPQEEMKQIILENPEFRLDTLRHIFGIDKYKTIRENSQLFTIKLREQTRLYEGQIKDLEDIKKRLQEKKEIVDELGKSLFVLKQELEIRKQEKENAKQEIKDVEEKIKEKEKYDKEVEKTQIRLVGKKELLISVEKEISEISKEIEEAKKTEFSKEIIGKLKTELENKEKEIEIINKEYLNLLSMINTLNLKISESEKLKSQISLLKICPTCLQDVDVDYKKNIIRKKDEEISLNTREISRQQQEKEVCIKKLNEFKKQVSEINKKLEELNLLRVKLEDIKEKESKIIQLEKQKESDKSDVSLLENQITRLKESSSLLKKYETIYQEKQKKLQELENKEREKEIELASKEKEKEFTLDLIKEINLEIDKKQALKSKVSELIELEDWLSSSFLSLISLTERNIMFKLREEFSKLFNEWFNILVPEIFIVRLDEDFTPIIEQQDFQLDYSFLSGGERTSIALAYRLALNQVINSLLSKIKTRDLVILDEPTEGFSEQQLDKMRDVLDELKVRQLIIVSHESKIESFVENIIKFKKENGVTKVES